MNVGCPVLWYTYMFYDLMDHSIVYVESNQQKNIVMFGESKSEQVQLILFH